MLLGKKPIKVVLFVVIALAGVIIPTGLHHRSVTIPLWDGTVVAVKSASIFNGFSGSKLDAICTVQSKNKMGKDDTVIFRQDASSSPVIVIPASTSGVFFCVYDNEFDWQLIRINTGQPFETLPEENPLSLDILSSTCSIHRVLKDETIDWNSVATAIDGMSDRQFNEVSIDDCRIFGIRLGVSRGTLGAAMRRFGDQGQYPGDTFIPKYTNLNSNFKRQP